jgi:hypothetical protein
MTTIRKKNSKEDDVFFLSMKLSTPTYVPANTVPMAAFLSSLCSLHSITNQRLCGVGLLQRQLTANSLVFCIKLFCLHA